MAEGLPVTGVASMASKGRKTAPRPSCAPCSRGLKKGPEGTMSISFDERACRQLVTRVGGMWMRTGRGKIRFLQPPYPTRTFTGWKRLRCYLERVERGEPR